MAKLRQPWVQRAVITKLNDALARRNEESTKADVEILDTIGPSGELRLQGGTGKALQLISIDSTDDPYTVEMSDKAVKIICKISAEARRRFESSAGIRISAIKGAALKVDSFEIYFFGVDGRSFWRGATDQSKIFDEPVSRESSKVLKRDARNNSLAGISTVKDLKAGNKDGELLPMPVFYIAEFSLIDGSRQDTFRILGNPVTVSSKKEIKKLLSKLPRMASSWSEFTLSESGIFSSKKNTSSTSSKWSTGDQTSDDEFRSQPDVYNSNLSSQGVSQLPFTTQAYAQYVEDFSFSTHESQEGESGATTSPSLPRYPESSPQGTQNLFRPQDARMDSKQKVPNKHSKFINYSNDFDSKGPTINSVIKEWGSGGLSIETDNRNKRKRGDCSTSGSDSDVGERRRSFHPDWPGSREITLEQAIIPEDQLETLLRPESFYSYKNECHVSGYDLIPKKQPAPKLHPAREPPKSSNIQIIVPPASAFRSPPTPTGTALSWSSSPVRSPFGDINTMPPDSSFLSDAQSPLAGRWSTQENIPDTQGGSNGGSSNQHSQVSIKVEKTPSAQLHSVKRVTRAANGISKKTPVDPNNVEPSRMAKASKKQHLPAVRKKRPRDYQSEESESDESPGREDNIDELINHPDLPVDIVDPNGRTRLDVFGSILKVQQVELWEKAGKQPQKHQDEEDEGEDTISNANYDSNSDNDCIYLTGNKQPCDGEANIDDNVPSEASSKEKVRAAVRGSSGPNTPTKQTKYQQNTENRILDHDMLNHHSENDEPPPPSQPSGIFPIQGGNQKTPEPLLESLVELSTVKGLDIYNNRNQEDDEDEGEIPQIPLTSLNSTLNCTARALDILHTQCASSDMLNGGSIETSRILPDTEAIPEPEHKKGSLGTALPPAFSEIPNTPKSQKMNENITPRSASSISITDPSIQVKETPYGKEIGDLDKHLSPIDIKSRSRIRSECVDDLMLVPGTNIGEAQTPRHLTPSPVDQKSPTTKSKGLKKNSSDDLSRSQAPIHGAKKRWRIEVPAALEVDETEGKDSILPRATALAPRPRPRKIRKALKAVDFGTQEIRAVSNARSVTDRLEEQKREFMGLNDTSSFKKTAEWKKPLLGECPIEDSEASDTARLRIRKRIQSLSPKPLIMAKKLRIDAPPDKLTEVQTIPSPEKQGVELSGEGIKEKRLEGRKPEERLFCKACFVKRGFGGGGLEFDGSLECNDDDHMASSPDIDLGDSDLMDGFINIDLGDDEPMVTAPETIGVASNSEKDTSPEPSQIRSSPKMYAGIRVRDIDVPGYEKLTAEQYEVLDKRRKEYFGVETSERLISVERQRAMPKIGPWANREDAKRARVGQGDEWHHNENTPMKIFFRKFQELEQSKMSKMLNEESNKREG